jgi:DNA-binding CsgD family transcriptional regulator
LTQNTSVTEPEVLRRSLKALTRRTGCAVAFGGLTTPDSTPLTAFVGTRGHSLDGLLIEPSQGAGGRAVIDRKPVATTQYRESPVITHRYDREVTAEGIVSLLAVPVVVDHRVCAIIYSGHRVATQFGDDTVRETLKVAKAMEWELSVSAEVDRRFALLETDGHAPGNPDPLSRERLELREAFAELRELSRAIADPEISRRLDAVGQLVTPSGQRLVTTPSLSPREIDMLAEVALGKRNAQIAAQLGLTEATVKSYLSSALHKLGSRSRYEAVIEARRAGLIP